MSVKVRLRRMGKKKQPFYRIVAIDSSVARGGRYLENLGTYNPIKSPAQIEMNEERVLYWLGQGAILSDTVRSFCKRKGILLKWHLLRNGVDDAAIEEGIKRWESQQEERVKKAEALAEQAKREAEKVAQAEQAAKEKAEAKEAKAKEKEEARNAEEAIATDAQEAEAADAVAEEVTADSGENQADKGSQEKEKDDE